MCTSYSFLSGDFCRTPGGFNFNLCTESLGFESTDERATDEGRLDGWKQGGETSDCSAAWGRARRKSEERKRVVEFPPPLTSMDERGRRDFVLRSVRKDGRLELTEVRIRRPEIMLATRENGRLTLRLIGNPDEDEEEESEEEEVMDGGDGGEGDDGGELRSPATGGEGGEAAPRRCYEYDLAGHRQLDVWSPRCVTTM